MKTITEIINKADTPLKKLINQANSSKKLEKVLYSILDKNLAKHCQFANYQNHELSIMISNAAWATRFRYVIPEIMKQLRTQPEFKTINRIRYMVSTNNKPSNKTQNKIKKISSTNENLWQKTISDLKKKIALDNE